MSEVESRHLRTPVWQRLSWFAAIWAASVLALGVVAYGIRLALK